MNNTNTIIESHNSHVIILEIKLILSLSLSLSLPQNHITISCINHPKGSSVVYIKFKEFSKNNKNTMQE